MENTGLKWGLIGAAASLLISLITYLIGPKVYIYADKYISAVAILIIMYLSGKEAREKQGGYITFQEIIRPIFLTFVIIAVASTLIQLLMMKVVDPGMAETLKQVAMDGMEKAKSFIGDEAYDKAMEEMEGKDFSGSFKDSALGLAFSIIFGFGLSAIYAAIMKKKNPELVQ